MDQISMEFEFQGRTLRQLCRTGMVALYEMVGQQGMTYGFELVIIKISPACEIMGRAYPEREAYPSSVKGSNDWGTIAWSYGRGERAIAEQGFDCLCRRREARQGRAKTEAEAKQTDLAVK